MKRWLAKDAAKYLAEFKKHVPPELLAIQLYNAATTPLPRKLPRL